MANRLYHTHEIPIFIRLTIMEQSQAYCPSALSLIFKSCPHKTIAKRGSIGVGCTIDRGITATVRLSNKTQVYFNNTITTISTVTDAVKKLTNHLFEIRLVSSLPLGSGFGLSGAATLATLCAINQALNLNKKESELALFAHQSEIENGTGLGTVATEITGGFLLKSESGIPVSAVQLPFTGQKLYTVILGPILTSTVLKNVSAITKNNRAANKALRLIHSLLHPTLSDIIDVSLDYILETSFLTKKTKDVIDMIKDQNIHATMAILGDVIICDKKPSGLDGHRIEELMITRDTVSVIKE